MNRAISLNFDDSAGNPPGIEKISLAHWQEKIRFGCSLKNFAALEKELNLPARGLPRLALVGSGDFHHISHLLVKQHAASGPFQIVVFDNHPDNMLFPFGIHCGSWVWHASRLPFVSRITVVGITSGDIGAAHLWENHRAPLRTGKISYLALRPVPPLARALGLRGIHDIRARMNDLPAALDEHILRRSPDPIYLSMDKDVLSKSVVETNWDQGVMTAPQLLDSIRLLRPRTFAADITGETSFHTYSTRWKKFLSRLDGQTTESNFDLPAAQKAQHALNEKIIAALE